MRIPYKPLFSFLLSLLLLTGTAHASVDYGPDGPVPYQPDPGSTRVIEAQPEGKLNAICVEGDAVYLLEQNALWRADDELNKLEPIHTFEEDLCGFSVSGGQFYFSYVDGDRTVFARLTEDGQTERLFDTTAERPMFKMVVAGENVCVMWLYSGHEYLMHMVHTDYAGCKIDVYTLDGELRVEDLFDGAMDMAYHAECGLILLPDFHLWANTDLKLPTWDPQTGRLGELEDFSFGGYKLAILPDGSGFYNCGEFVDADLGLFRYERGRYAISRQFVGLCMDPDWEDAALACTRTRLYCYRLRGDMNLHSMELPENAPDADAAQSRLTIAYPSGDDAFINDPVMQAALSQFRRLCPEAGIHFEPFELPQLKTALMAGDDYIDLLFVNMYYMSSLVEMGALYDLNDDAELRQRMAQWTGNQALCWKGIRYGVPVWLDTDCLTPNAKLSEFALNLDWQHCTWLDFLQQAEQFETDTNGDGAQDIWLLGDTVGGPQWLFQYANTFADIKDVNFDTETFRALAAEYKRCYDKGVLIDWNDAVQQPDTVAYITGRISDLNRTDYLPLPSIAGESEVPAYTYSLALSKSTAQYDLAMDFLQCFTSDEVQSQSPFIGLAADTSIYPEYARLQNPLKQQMEAQKAYVNRGVAQWRNGDYNVFQAEQFEKYLNDQIALDELISSLQQKLQMVVWG